MRLIFVGPQGSGKGTQADIISKKLKIAHISTGDLLRNISGGLKEEVDSYIDHGNLVPDDLILRILNERIIEKDCDEGFILDGFPRNLVQAKELDNIMDVDEVIEIDVSDKESVKRISGRRGCVSCGAIFNVETSPRPITPGVCDRCGGDLTQRKDDNETALKKRLETYHKETKKILSHYKSVKVNGEQDIEKVTEDILKILK
ncbi:nucleoside monophosphate kinase [Candidatus Pacearchaeota archaeon]|nr:nucleoside monophosphate kinase [Candidatus Pacearchaeota archaeon]